MDDWNTQRCARIRETRIAHRVSTESRGEYKGGVPTAEWAAERAEGGTICHEGDVCICCMNGGVIRSFEGEGMVVQVVI